MEGVAKNRTVSHTLPHRFIGSTCKGGIADITDVHLSDNVAHDIVLSDGKVKVVATKDIETFTLVIPPHATPGWNISPKRARINPSS